MRPLVDIFRWYPEEGPCNIHRTSEPSYNAVHERSPLRGLCQNTPKNALGTLSSKRPRHPIGKTLPKKSKSTLKQVQRGLNASLVIEMQ